MDEHEEYSKKKEKRVVPELTFKEFLERENGNKLFQGPYKIIEKDVEKLIEYLKRR